jgi:hypothetical protein
MPSNDRILVRAVPWLAATALTLALGAGASLAGASTARAPLAQHGAHAMQQGGAFARRGAGGGSQDLYLGNILGGVLLYSTPKDEHQVGDITDQLPRVTDVWVDKTGILYAFTDNSQNPYETIEEFQPGATSPFFSLVLQRYGSLVAADAKQNVYAQGVNAQAQQVIDVYAPGSQTLALEYVVPTVGQMSAVEGMAFDASGALLVGVAADAENRQGQTGTVFRLDPRSGKFINLNLKNAVGGLIATDGAGNLYVGGNESISVYAPGATTPSRTFHTKSGIVNVAAASNGTLYVNMYQEGIAVYAPGKNHTKNTFIPQAQVSGLALGPG